MHNITFSLKKIALEAKDRKLSTDYITILLKEYLQDAILFAIYNSASTKSLIFYGGTCLRKVYQLNRLSEDLDFENPNQIPLEVIDETIHKYFKGIKFTAIETKIQKGELVNRITLKFPILFDLELSAYESEKLYVKVEVNNKLSGSYETIKSTYARNTYSIMLNHYSLETLFAGKILACLERNYKKGDSSTNIKGRDFYDLLWYMNGKRMPDKEKLTDTNPKYTLPEIWKLLDKKVETITKEDLERDLLPLFENSEFISTWCENFHSIYMELRKNYI